MHHRALPFALACCATFALAACSSAPRDEATTPAADAPVASAPAPAPAATTAPPAMQECNADAAQDVVGRKATEEVIEQARQSSGATVARALRPDMVITMEYRGDRLNLRTDTNDVVVSVGCG